WYQFRSNVASQFATHTIPLGTLGLTKWHKLFFGSDNPPDCERLGNVCSSDHPQWRNVVVMPFKASQT
ncbi:MAG TPA: hypothetical protein VLA89_08875, partial [Gemmatimonadales bacterium]|nr:hypothetical protein [Gemmatimonadales bacterium]